MSADNWTHCPRCTDEARKAVAAEHDRVMALYGTVSVEEFDRQRAALEPVKVEATFREDYEFWGAEEGTVHASYRGTCTGCGLRVELRTEKTFWPSVPGEEVSG